MPCRGGHLQKQYEHVEGIPFAFPRDIIVRASKQSKEGAGRCHVIGLRHLPDRVDAYDRTTSSAVHIHIIRHRSLILQTQYFPSQPPFISQFAIDMASSTKYQPAPQRDSFEEQPSYSQAPPLYQPGSNPADADYGSTRRSEDDNVPDDFKVSGLLCN